MKRTSGRPVKLSASTTPTAGWLAVAAIPEDSASADIEQFLGACTCLFKLCAEDHPAVSALRLPRLCMYRRGTQVVLFIAEDDGLASLLAALALLQQIGAPPFAAVLRLGMCQGWITPEVRRDIFGKPLTECATFVAHRLAHQRFGVVVLDDGGAMRGAARILGMGKTVPDSGVFKGKAAPEHDDSLCKSILVLNPTREDLSRAYDYPLDVSRLAEELLSKPAHKLPTELLTPALCSGEDQSNFAVIAVELIPGLSWESIQEAFQDLNSIVNEEIPALCALADKYEESALEHPPRVLFEHTGTGFCFACRTLDTDRLVDWIESFICALDVSETPVRVGISYGHVIRHRAATLFNHNPVWLFSGEAAEEAKQLAQTIHSERHVKWAGLTPEAKQMIVGSGSPTAPLEESFQALRARVQQRDNTKLTSAGRTKPYSIGRGYWGGLKWISDIFGASRTESVVAQPFSDTLYQNLRRAQVHGLLHTAIETTASIGIMVAAVSLLDVYDWGNHSFVQMLGAVWGFAIAALLFALLGAFALESLLMRRLLPCMERHQLESAWQEIYARASTRMRSALAKGDGKVVRELAGWAGWVLWAEYLIGPLRSLRRMVRGVAHKTRLQKLFVKGLYPQPLGLSQSAAAHLNQVTSLDTLKLLPKRALQPEVPTLIFAFAALGGVGYTVWGYAVASISHSEEHRWLLLICSIALGITWNLALVVRTWQPFWSLSLQRRRALRRVHDAGHRERLYGTLVLWLHVILIIACVAALVALVLKSGIKGATQGSVAASLSIIAMTVNLYLFRLPTHQHNLLIERLTGIGISSRSFIEQTSAIGEALLGYPYNVAVWSFMKQGELLDGAIRRLAVRGLKPKESYFVADFYGMIQSYGGDLWAELGFSTSHPPFSAQDVFGDGAGASYIAGQQACHAHNGQWCYFVTDLNGPLVNEQQKKQICAIELTAVRKQSSPQGCIVVLRPLCDQPVSVKPVPGEAPDGLSNPWHGAQQLSPKPPSGHQGEQSTLPSTPVMEEYDVFISYNSRENDVASDIANRLKNCKKRVWFDEWELAPGSRWQERLEDIIQTTRTVAVLIGRDGLGPWEEPEMRACLIECKRRELGIIPVFLPGCPQNVEPPLFLKEYTCLDLRDGLTEEGIDKLVWGIDGNRPVTILDTN